MRPADFRLRLATLSCAITLVALTGACTRSGDLGNRLIVVSDSVSEKVYVRLVFGYDAAGCAVGSAWMVARVLEGSDPARGGALLAELRSLGVIVRATAEREALIIDVDMPKSSEEKAWPLLAGHLSQAVSESLAIDKLQSSQHATLDSLRSAPEWLSTAAYWYAVFQDTPYSLPPIGSDSAIERLAVGDVETFRREFITSGNYIMGLSGQVGDRDALALDRILQERLPSGNSEVTQRQFAATNGLNVRIVDGRDLQQATVLVATAPLPGVSDTASLILAMSAVLHATQGGSLTGMDQALRIERGLSERLDITTTRVLASTIGASPRTGDLTHSSNFAVGTETATINALYAVRIILKELSDLNTNGIATEDIQRLSAIVRTAEAKTPDALTQMHSQVATRWMGHQTRESEDTYGPTVPTSAKTRSVLRNLVDPANLWIVLVVPDAANFRSAIVGGTTAYMYPEWVDDSMIRRLDQEYLSYRPFWQAEKLQVLYADSLFR